jgi:hypothetical protein
VEAARQRRAVSPERPLRAAEGSRPPALGPRGRSDREAADCRSSAVARQVLPAAVVQRTAANRRVRRATLAPRRVEAAGAAEPDLRPRAVGLPQERDRKPQRRRLVWRGTGRSDRRRIFRNEAGRSDVAPRPGSWCRRTFSWATTWSSRWLLCTPCRCRAGRPSRARPRLRCRAVWRCGGFDRSGRRVGPVRSCCRRRRLRSGRGCTR